MPSDFRTASQGAIPFIAGAYALAVLYTGNNLPSALYGVFRAEFVFSPLTQTLLYATAVAVILPGLLIAGPLSDSIGRRARAFADRHPGRRDRNPRPTDRHRHAWQRQRVRD